MIDLQTVSIILACISVSVAALYYIFTLRYTRMNLKNTLETRQAQLFMQVYERWNSSEFINFWFEFTSADLDNYEFGTDRELDVATRAIARFMEGIGVLLKRKLIEVEFVDDLMSSNIIEFWETIREFIVDLRTRGYPQYGEWAEYLYEQIKPIVELQHPELKT